MAFNLHVFKEHPIAIVGVLGVGIVVYFVYKNKNQAQTQTVAGVPQVSDAVQQAAIQAGTQLQLANASAAAQTNQNNFQLQQTGQEIAGQYALTDLQGKTATVQQVNQIQGNIALQGQQLSTQSQIASETIAADLAKSQAADMLSLELAKTQTGANIAVAGINADVSKSIAGINASTTEALAQYQTQAVIAQTQAQVDITKSNNEAQQNIASHSGGNSVGGILGGVASVIGSFF